MPELIADLLGPPDWLPRTVLRLAGWTLLVTALLSVDTR